MNTAPEFERKTPAVSERLDSDKRPFNPAAFLAGKDRITRRSLMVALLAMIVALWELFAAWAKASQKVLFVVLDPNGNVIVAPGATFAEAKQLHVQQALLATTALLLRNPKDFDQPEFLQALYSRGALAQATALKAAEAPEFQERQIQQKPQIARIDAIVTRQEEVQVQVTGQLTRWGIVQQAPYTEAVPFTLRLVLKANPDLLRMRRQPTVVTQFTLRYETPRS
jgi:hypothetical protein